MPGRESHNHKVFRLHRRFASEPPDCAQDDRSE